MVLGFCPDVQAETYDYCEAFFEPRVWRIRPPKPDRREVADDARIIAGAERPVIISGGDVLYSGAEAVLRAFAETRNIFVLETQAGKGGIAARHALNFGLPGVIGSGCGNERAAAADLVIGMGTRFQDFTTGSWTVIGREGQLVLINRYSCDAQKHLATPLVADAKVTLERLTAALSDLRFDAHDPAAREAWIAEVGRVTAGPEAETNALPTDAQVIDAVQRAARENTMTMCAAGTMPGSLQVLWQAEQDGYHMEYGYFCTGYKVAGAMGIKLADPSKEVICFVGDGSYMIANSELATAAARKVAFSVVLTDNLGYGCIKRLQIEYGGAESKNLCKDSDVWPKIDFVAHAAAMRACAEKAADIAELERRSSRRAGATCPRSL